jgi:hypothetical protein
LLLAAGCESGPNTQRGAATGAIAGAVLGGIIGHQSGEAAAGAALGAAAGGAAGAAYGQHKDRAANSSDAGRDAYGYTSAEYLSLVTPEEREILRERARGSQTVDLAVFLTDQEKANLRNRAASRAEIGR